MNVLVEGFQQNYEDSVLQIWVSRVVHNFKVMNDLNRGDHFEKKEVGGIDVHNMTLHLKNVQKNYNNLKKVY